MAETRARQWREALGLTVAEAAEAVDMSRKNGATRWREFESAASLREPTEVMLGYMTLTENVVEALVMLRSGRPDDAKRILERAMTAPLNRVIRARAPGQEAVGPAPPRDSYPPLD